MNNFLSRRICGALLAATCFIYSTENLQAADPAKTIGSYLDSQTSNVVVRVDLKQVNVTGLLKQVLTVLPIPKDPRVEKQAAKMDRAISALRTAKANELYVVFDVAQIGEKPFLIIPVEQDGDFQSVISLMYTGDVNAAANNTSRRSPFEICTRYGDVVFCGSKIAFTRLKKIRSQANSDLAKAFQATKGDAVQVVFLPGKDHRRVLAEMLTELPKIAGGGSGKDLVNEVQWASVGLQLPPKLSVNLIVQSRDAQAAQSLKNRIDLALNLFAQQPDVRRDYPQVDKIKSMLTPRTQGTQVRINIDFSGKKLAELAAIIAVPVLKARQAAQRASSRNNLRQIAIAMHNFHETYKSFPPHSSYDKNGKKLLSWRVFLLPYLEQQALFQKFRLNEPWDSPHNKKLLKEMPKVFAVPGSKATQKGYTRYVAPVGKSLVFTGKPEGIRIRDIIDGTSNTIMILQVPESKAVPWTKPDDITINLDKPLTGLVEKNDEHFLAAFCDGSVRTIMKTIKPKTLRAMFTRNGGEVIAE